MKSSAANLPTLTMHAKGTWTDGQYAVIGSTSGNLTWSKPFTAITGYKLLDRTRYVDTTGGPA